MEAELLARHLTIFPEGQLVAVDESSRVLGSASSLIIDWDDYAESAKWSVITGAGTFDTHNPLGKTLYGADIGVDPLARRQGVWLSPVRGAQRDCPGAGVEAPPELGDEFRGTPRSLQMTPKNMSPT